MGSFIHQIQSGSSKKKNDFSPPRIPRAISSQILNILYNSDPHDQRKWVTWPNKQKKYIGFGLSLGAKLVSTNDRPSTCSTIFSFFFPAGAKTDCAAFCTIHWNVLQGIPVEFSRQNSRSDLPVFNIKQNLAKKLDPRLKSSRLKDLAYPNHFYAQKSKCPRRF